MMASDTKGFLNDLTELEEAGVNPPKCDAVLYSKMNPQNMYLKS